MSTVRSDRSNAEKFAQSAAASFGAVFLLVGILGFVPGVTSNYDTMTFASHESEAELLGIFQVSILHNLVHLLFGVAGLAAARQVRNVVPYLVGGGIIYLALTVYGVLIDHDSAANFVPVNSADNWLHLVLGAGMVALGLVVQRRLRAGTTSAKP
jgi:hypothetical protein